MTDLGHHDRLTPLEVLRRYRPHARTLTDLVASRAEADPHREMLVAGGRSWSWAEGLDAAARLAGHLRGRGIGVGDRLVVMARNSEWHVFALLAAARLGAIFIPVNPDFKVEEASYVIGQSRAAGVLADDGALDVARSARDAAASTAWVVPLGPDLLAGEPLGDDAAAPDRGCVIIYTSGTTGFPKGVLHSQESVLLAGECFIERMHLQPHDRVMAILPLFHVNGLFYSVAGTLAAGATLLVEPGFSASRFWHRVAELRATEVNMIEAVGAILLKRPEGEYVPDHGLLKIYGIRQSLMERFNARFGIPRLVGGYGMTEIPGILSTPYGGTPPVGTMGELCRHPDPDRPWARCRVVDDAGADLPDGEVGELWVHTPAIMLGYFRDPEQTGAAFSDGWFRTGDLVRRDASGAYAFVARKKDIIRRKGENISGAELDRVVAEHPDVVLAAAVGVASEFGDQDILVAATLREGATVTEAELADFCRSRLAGIKVPRYVVFVDELPLTPSGKVAKHVLQRDPSLVERATEPAAPPR